MTDALTKMTQYAFRHLTREEQLLSVHGYPAFAPHKEEHARYRARTAYLCLELMEGRTETPAEIGAFLREWWNDHVLKSDMAYKSFLNAKGVR